MGSVAGSRKNFIAGLGLLGIALAAAPAQATESWTLIGSDVFSYEVGAYYRGQGVTTDGTNWYFSGTNGLEITDGQYNPRLRSFPAIPDSLANPSPLAAQGLNHIGDIDYANGFLYISLDTSDKNPATGGRYESPVFAVYNASDLSFTGQAYALNPPHGTHDIASWVAVDADKGLGYGMAYDNATEIAVYNLVDWTFNKYIPLSQSIDSAQGGKIHGDWMYFASDDDTKTIRRANLLTGEVEELFDIFLPYDQEIEGLSFLDTPGGLTLNVLNWELPDPNGLPNLVFYHYQLAAVPEPGTMALMLGGLGGLAAARRATRRVPRR